MVDFSKDQIESDLIAYYSTPEMLETLESCWGLGPLSICARFISVDQIQISIKLAGVKIGSGMISTKNTKVCASANIGLVKASVCTKADYPNKVVWVEGKLCHREWDLGWKCHTFKTKLISW